MAGPSRLLADLTLIVPTPNSRFVGSISMQWPPRLTSCNSAYDSLSYASEGDNSLWQMVKRKPKQKSR